MDKVYNAEDEIKCPHCECYQDGDAADDYAVVGRVGPDSAEYHECTNCNETFRAERQEDGRILISPI